MKQTLKKPRDSVFRENVSITWAIQLPSNTPSAR